MRSFIRAAELLTRWHVAQPRPHRPTTMTAAERDDRRRTRRFGWADRIRGVGVGVKRVRGRRTGLPCLIFYVSRKYALRDLSLVERIPSDLRLRSLGAPLLTDVVVMRGRPRAHAAADVRPGYEVAHADGEPGTMGLLVRRNDAPGRYALSCSHVLALGGTASPGSVVETPSSVDPDPMVNAFGTLELFTKLSTVGVFREDIALARVDVPSRARLYPHGVVPQSIYPEASGFDDTMDTELWGAVTARAAGVVSGASWSGKLSVPHVGPVTFAGLVPYQTVCAEGDSGGVVLRRGTTEVLGLHIGGTKPAGLQQAFFMPLSGAFDRLGLRLVKTD